MFGCILWSRSSKWGPVYVGSYARLIGWTKRGTSPVGEGFEIFNADHVFYVVQLDRVWWGSETSMELSFLNTFDLCPSGWIYLYISS